MPSRRRSGAPALLRTRPSRASSRPSLPAAAASPSESAPPSRVRRGTLARVARCLLPSSSRPSSSSPPSAAASSSSRTSERRPSRLVLPTVRVPVDPGEATRDVWPRPGGENWGHSGGACGAPPWRLLDCGGECWLCCCTMAVARAMSCCCCCCCSCCAAGSAYAALLYTLKPPAPGGAMPTWSGSPVPPPESTACGQAGAVGSITTC